MHTGLPEGAEAKVLALRNLALRRRNIGRCTRSTVEQSNEIQCVDDDLENGTEAKLLYGLCTVEPPVGDLRNQQGLI